MGFMDSFGKEDRTEIKFSTLYELLKEVAKSELTQNAVKCGVPHSYILEMMTGEPQEKLPKIGFYAVPNCGNEELPATKIPNTMPFSVDPAQASEKPDEEPETEPQKKPNRKPRVDVGKLLALHDAKWTEQAIADELGCSVQTVQRHIVQAGKNNEDVER